MVVSCRFCSVQMTTQTCYWVFGKEKQGALCRECCPPDDQEWLIHLIRRKSAKVEPPTENFDGTKRLSMKERAAAYLKK